MAKKLSFNIPTPREPEGRMVTAEEAEKIALEELEEAEWDLHNAVVRLVSVYSRTGRQDLAMHHMQRLMMITEDPQRKAYYLLSMGQLSEQSGNFEAALSSYEQALPLEPADQDVWYLINNNLGFCLNHFRRHKEAERYCRKAIKIDPRRHNAYKNLGVSFEGQGEFTAAAKQYLKAVQANAANPRALGHLEDLLAKHGEIVTDIPDIHDQLKQCREAVQLARQKEEEYEQRLQRRLESN